MEQKSETHLYAAYKRLRSKDTHRLKVKWWKKIFHANDNQNKAEVVTFIPQKVDF